MPTTLLRRRATGKSLNQIDRPISHHDHPRASGETMTDYSPTTSLSSENTDHDSSRLTARAADAAAQGRDSSAQVAQVAADETKRVAQQTGQQARNLLGEAQGQVRQRASDQQQNIAQKLRSIGDELGGMIGQTERSGTASELLSQAQVRLCSLAQWLEHREPGDVLDEVRSFARRRPGPFLAGAAIAGVLAGRLTRGVQGAHSSQQQTSADGESDHGSNQMPTDQTTVTTGARS
jgi:hypothetical protein